MVMVACSKGTREVLPGMRWRDLMTGSEWEVVELAGTRTYSPSGFGGTLNFWCRAVGDMPLHATRFAEYARADGCVEFCGDSIAAMLLTPIPCTTASGSSNNARSSEQDERAAQEGTT